MFHHFIRFNERASHLLVDNREQCIRPMTGRKGRSDLTPSCVPVVCGTRQVNQHLLLIGLQYLCVWMLRPFQPFGAFVDSVNLSASPTCYLRPLYIWFLLPENFVHETNFGGGRCDPFRWFFDPSYIKHSNFSLTILIATFSTQLCDDVPI